MLLSPIRYVQSWSMLFPGEASLNVRLPTCTSTAHQREVQRRRDLERSGIAPRDQDTAQPIQVPVAPAQPLLQLSVEGFESQV